jgi:CBS domain-containing protein
MTYGISVSLCTVLNADRSPFAFGSNSESSYQRNVRIEWNMSELKIDITEPVSKFVQVPIMVTSNQTVKAAAKLMSDQKSGAAIVTEDNVPIGIITEWDILSRLVATGKNADSTRVKEIMSIPLTIVSPETKVGDAITLMVRNGHRRLVVKDSKKFLGIVTMSQVVGNQKESSIQLAMLEPSKGVRCPYCGSILKDREALSNHVDSIHVREDFLKGIHGMNM